MNSFFYSPADSKLLEKIQLDQPNNALTLFFHEEKLAVNTRLSLERTLKTLKRSEKEGELFCRKRDVTLTKKDNEKERSALRLSGNLNDALSLLLGEEIITVQECFELSAKLDVQKSQTKTAIAMPFAQHWGQLPKTAVNENEEEGEKEDQSKVTELATHIHVSNDAAKMRLLELFATQMGFHIIEMKKLDIGPQYKSK